METLKAIYSRRSVRSFDTRPVEDEKIHELLKAAMSGPCCVNAREWEFIVVTDKDILCRMADANGRPAQLLKKAPLGILICANLNEAFRPAPEYYAIDCAIAAQNICLAAHDLGLGACWLGTWPQMHRASAQAEILGLPDYILPQSIIAAGYPESGGAPSEERDLYDPAKAHFGSWNE
ncbi:MAG: nitroreductase family protein [Clostridia bacterium]|nr:nitroreductase family protein [Clostridia bacterium]